jgi:hypothetical protein
MTDPLQRDALRLIQDVVIETKGSPLDREAVHSRTKNGVSKH